MNKTCYNTSAKVVRCPPVPRYFTHIIERSDPELLVLETDRCLFEDPKFKCALQNFRMSYCTRKYAEDCYLC